MRIKQILVRDLFGMFNHEINLNLEDRITIIHGPNGVGKTILLRMINAIFNSRYSELLPIPFTTLTINFDDGSSLAVLKKHDNEAEKVTLEFTFTRRIDSDNNIIRFEVELETEPLSYRNILLERLFENSRQKTSQNNLIRFSYYITKQEVEEESRLALLEILEKLPVKFIKTDRLLTPPEKKNEEIPPEEDSRDYAHLDSVNNYANDLIKQIQAKQAEYATLSQSLDRTFPARVVKQKSDANLTEEMLREKFDKTEMQRQRLIKVGLLNDETSDFELGQNIDPNTKQILSVYLEDVEKKLSVFQELARKIELFQKIIATKFQYKHMHISKDKGFTFTTHEGNPLAPTYLSSGEQHELVMLYELLFKVKPNSLILIDEPELSLHVGWQVEFLEDLQQIAQLGNFDVLMATHSPSLIGDRWDLTVALKG